MNNDNPSPEKDLNMTTPVQVPEHEHSILEDIDMVDVEETLEKYDSESVMVENKGILAHVITVMAVILSIFQLFLASPWGTMPAAQARAIHLGFVMALLFLNVPIAKKKDGTLVNFVPWNVVASLLSLGFNIYLYTRINPLAANGNVLTNLDYYLFGALVVLVLVAGRRSLGWIMTILPIIFIVYALFGRYLPGALQHRGFILQRIIK